MTIAAARNTARRAVARAMRLRPANKLEAEAANETSARRLFGSLAGLRGLEPAGAALGATRTANPTSNWLASLGVRSACAANYSSVTVSVPEMGDSITEGSIATIEKSAGDAVAEDEVIVQVETDKVTIDIRSPGAGVVQEILVAEEDTVVVGQPVAKVELGAAGA
eukprot:CAMPEP_0196648342 /NCGR_PEP_ID=MMETSP1085-20130531/13314_1 /TAXON_ID=41879 ORGANISM="Pycnococcus sp, Strain CCMP1998" /NCGR_SAMPLE_ID=MMETSP1085 /ASSEMBLY_ACC=CAM_ASM_000807 /LENGTH=165 /DNA_ID=CAMNT_0041978131 /DNA_START=62 /DNA_END=556 /DNA_ORIENTATION=-